jgi:hypothetical protein
MVKRKKKKMIYKYSCTLSNQVYKTTRQAPNPGDLMSVRAYYELNPAEDDRPEAVKLLLEGQQSTEDLFASGEEDDEEDED